MPLSDIINQIANLNHFNTVTMNYNFQSYFENLDSLKEQIASNPNNLIYIAAFAFFCLINFKKSRQSLLYRVYIAAYTALFALIGARLAYIIFYDPQYYLSNPKEILMITDGNLSLHGALVGGALGLFYLDKKNLSLNADKAVLVALFMIPLGQITSFFDSDFFRNLTQTNGTFSLFGANANYRQNLGLYGAFCNGPLMGVALYALRKFKRLLTQGSTALYFVAIYSFMNIFLENFQEGGYDLTSLVKNINTQQILSVATLGLALKFLFGKKRTTTRRTTRRTSTTRRRRS